MLSDKDRIFTNIYGREDFRLAGARKRGDWDGTAASWRGDGTASWRRMKASNLRGRGGAGFPTGLQMVVHAQGVGRAGRTTW